jgi:predicted enzyme related to lactoylglutathione lyase
MPERTSYLPGTPSWVDLGSPDTAASAAFYGSLLGWTAEFDERPEAGGYGMFTLQGKNVAGIGPQMNMDMPPFWACYVTVANVEDTAKTVTANGGQVVAGPMQVFDAGKMAVFMDPNGTFISAWQPDQHIGCELVNEVGTFGWNELASNDMAKSNEFYTSIFPWQLGEGSSETGTTYAVDGNIVCGGHPANEGEFPAWSVWFGVDDCDASAAKATELGGTVVMPPMDMDFGRGAMVADPQGAVFGIAAVNPEMLDG